MTVAKTKTAVLTAIACSLGTQVAMADGYFDQGKKLYDQKKYTAALPYFHKSAQDQPWDSSAAYYEALSYHMTGDYKKAATAYAYVVEHFPGSAAYVNAAAALKVLDPGYFSRHAQGAAAPASTSSSGTAAADDAQTLLAKVTVNAPSESRIPVKRVTDKVWVDGSINGHGLTFDFSGETTTITAKQAADAGLQAANGRAKASLRVGQIAEYDFPVKVGDTDRPRLGTDFFHKLVYRLGPTEILVTKAGAGSYELGFQKSGTDLKVSLTINGRHAGNVILDTQGGENVCPRNRAKELGLDVEDKSELNMVTLQNPDGALRGQPGFGEVKQTSFAQAKVIAVGPVGTGANMVNFRIDDKAKDVHVSASAFPGWQADIDEANKVIHFTRR